MDYDDIDQKNLDYDIVGANRPKNLFEYLPLSENVEKFINDYKYFFDDIKKEDFFKQNSHERVFIEALINSPPPQSLEEAGIKDRLLYKFINYVIDPILFNDSSNHKFEKLTGLIKEEFANDLNKEYEKIFTTNNSKPEFTINEYCEKVINEISKNQTQEEKEENIKKILNIYFEDIKNYNYHNKDIASAALLQKLVIIVPFKELNNIAFHFNKYSLVPREVLLDVISDVYLMGIQSFPYDRKNEKTYFRNWDYSINLGITLGNIAENILTHNKIMANYETLKVELIGTDSNKKDKKVKL